MKHNSPCYYTFTVAKAELSKTLLFFYHISMFFSVIIRQPATFLEFVPADKGDHVLIFSSPGLSSCSFIAAFLPIRVKHIYEY